MTDLTLAVVAGTLTIAAPCVLPMLPILLGTSVGQTSRARPVFLALGFASAFSLAAVAFSAFPRLLGLSPEHVRMLATALLAIFGTVMLWPRPFELLAMHFSGVVRRADAVGSRAGSGNAGGFVLGMMLGIVWTPCAGPVLASILALIAGARDLGQGALLLGGYALGAAVPMLAIAYGGQAASARVRRLAPYTPHLQRLFGVVVIATAAAIYFGYDTRVSTWLARFYPETGLDEPVATVNRPAPEFSGVENWFNSAPLAMHDLRGRVVLVDFWTYSCVNCLRTVPHVVHLHETYADTGLVVVGVHTPEFAFEHDADNVRAAIGRLGIRYPVAQDNDHATWRAYDNSAWPAQYLVDRNGTIVLTRFGEGHEQEIEGRIRDLLGAASAPGE